MITPEAELASAASAYRRRVRRASVAIVAGLIGALVVTAVLPSTEPSERSGLFVGAGIVGAASLVWFFLIPRTLFAAHRIFAAALLAQSALLAVLALSGGVGSRQFPYYLLPILVQIFGGQVGRAVLLGSIAGLGIVGMAAVQSGNGDPGTVRDIAVTRLLELATITGFASIAAGTTGGARRELAARTVSLAGETEANYLLAVTDPLTGLYNRRFMTDELDRLVARSTRQETPLTILAIDIDGLKAVNDTHGHSAGDDVLRAAGDAIREGLRASDIGVRVGGDEFIALLAGAGEDDTRVVRSRIRSAFGRRPTALGADLSFGLASWSPGLSTGDLLRLVDEKLYEAKRDRPQGRSGGYPVGS